MYIMRQDFFSFGCGCPVFPTQIDKDTTLLQLNDLESLIKNQFAVDVCVSFWTFNYVLLAFVCTHMSAPWFRD